MLYDVTSTYFEGQAEANPLAQRGYSRDHRPDCKQVCIGLVVSKCGMPLGYEVFAGNRADVTTLQEIVETMERRYGQADRIWVGDRGMVSADNIAFLKQSGRRYIVGTPKSMLKQFERELLSEDWHAIRDGLEVKLCPSPDGDETFVLCRSRDRREKEKAMHGRFEQRIEEGLRRIEASCQKQRLEPRGGGAARGATAGAKQSGGRTVSHRDQIVLRRPCHLALEEDRVVARLGRLERRLLPAAQQRDGLERRGPVEGVHPTDGGGGSVSHPQKRPAGCVRSGTRKRSGCWPTSWSASWPTCFGRRLPSVASEPDWGMSRGGCSRSWARSSWSTWCCPRVKGRRFAGVASRSPRTIKPSCWRT